LNKIYFYRDDISALKNENETLLDFIGALKENNEKEPEPGWTSLFHSQTNTDPVRSHYPDSPLMKKIESLSVMNAKLFHANKDWHNKWETLRQQTQEEKADLKSKVASLETINKNMKAKIACLEKELQIQNTSVMDLMKSSASFEEEKSTLHRINEALKTELTCLKTEIKDLTRSKRMMESELMSLKSSSKSKDSQQTGHKELQSEIGLLKQQLTIFKEDFDKERSDRLSAESKAEKYRKELKQTKLSLETRLQKMNAQIKIVENDLRTKARQNADLLYQVDDLKLKFQHELRKSSLALQNTYSFSHPPTSSYQGPVSLPYNSELNGHTTNPNLRGTAQHQFGNSGFASASYLHHSSPEHLPGAWKCRHCTYVNYPNRTVCDICGYTVSNVESLPIAESESGRNVSS
jgi:DNA repair exonuclease SbcCD ATPase subunit